MRKNFRLSYYIGTKRLKMFGYKRVSGYAKKS